MDILMGLLIVVVALLTVWLAVSIAFAVWVLRMVALGAFEGVESDDVD